jgi:predicted metal-dependent hydrolase
MAHAAPVPRSPSFDFSSAPRRWLAGDPVATHLVNAVNLLFPAGERFFVRSVHRHLPRVADPALLARARGFEKQEGHHARAHEQWFAALEAQGFEVRGLLAAYQGLCYGALEKVAPAALSLSVTAAAEHFTALMARDALALGVLERASPELKRLLLWHAAEELEHKSVAFDVLAAVAPGYPLRAAGMLLAGPLLGGLWAAAALALLWQERRLPCEPAAPRLEQQAGRRPGSVREIFARVFLRGVLDYLRPGFHPDEIDDAPLFEGFLANAGLS